ncbi:hypothetical protein KCU83_g293, partial [Aureobasidium melanogenum]
MGLSSKDVLMAKFCDEAGSRHGELPETLEWGVILQVQQFRAGMDRVDLQKQDANARTGNTCGFSSSNAHELGSVVDDQLLSREGHLLELLGVRGGDLSTSDSDRGSLQVVPGVLGGESQKLSTDTEAGETRLDGHHVASLLDRLDDSLNIKGLDGTEVDDLGLNAVLLLELLGGDQRLTDAAGEGDDGKVLSGTLDLGLAELADSLVLENNDGVGISDGGLHKTLGVLGAVRRNNLKTGDGAVPGRVILRVLSGDTSSETVGSTEGDVARLDTTRHVVGLCGRVDDLIDGLHGEVKGHELALEAWWRPARAAPTVRPVKPDSVMGESMTLFSPKRSSRPLVTL